MRLMQAGTEVVLPSPSSTFQSARSKITCTMLYYRVACASYLQISEQASIHMHAQCNHTSVAPAQGHPNKQLPICQKVNWFMIHAVQLLLSVVHTWWKYVCFLSQSCLPDNLTLSLFITFLEIQAKCCNSCLALAQNVADARTPR